MTGEERVREVFARVRNGDAGVADLYAEDGVVVVSASGEGDVVRGRDAIRAFYQQTIDAIAPQPQVRAVHRTGSMYIAEVDVPTTEGSRRAIDFFEVADDGIKRLVIFRVDEA